MSEPPCSCGLWLCPECRPENERRVVICPTRTPEPHELGEFPMTCYRCHIEADS